MCLANLKTGQVQCALCYNNENVESAKLFKLLWNVNDDGSRGLGIICNQTCKGIDLELRGKILVMYSRIHGSTLVQF